MKLLRLERQQRCLKSHFEFAYHLSSLFLKQRIRSNTSMQNRRRLMIVRGGNRHVIIKFKSYGCKRAKRFSTPPPPTPKGGPVNIHLGAWRNYYKIEQQSKQTNNKKDPDFIVCFTKKSDATGNELSNNKWQIKIFPVLIFFIISPILS